jgi:hypothetical protein
MRCHAAIKLCLCVCLLNTTVPVVAQPGGANDAETFRRRLLDAFARNDRRAVAGMVRYRLDVDAGGLIVPVVNAPTLLKMWDAVFPPEVRCMIERQPMTVDAGGASFGGGRMRVDRGADGLKIARLTLPPGYGTGLAGKPRPVLFKWGKGLATYRGRLSADNVDVYLVQARAGDLLNAQLQSISVAAATVRVVQTTGNRELAAAGPAGSEARRLWAGRVPENGEYRVEVVRRGAYCDPAVNYQLKVSLE